MPEKTTFNSVLNRTIRLNQSIRFERDLLIMSMKKWTDEELISTQEKLEEWSARYKKAGNKLWHFTAFLGALSISTGVAFIFFDGFDVLNILLIIMGSVTCFAWYKSEKRRQDNQNFLDEINKELRHREKRAGKSKTKQNGVKKDKRSDGADQTLLEEEQAADTSTTDKINSEN